MTILAPTAVSRRSLRRRRVERPLVETLEGRTLMSADVQQFASGFQTPNSIVTGPDGNLWVLDGGDGGQASISVVSTSGTVLANYAIPTQNSGAQDLTAGPNGTLWFVESQADQIGEITTSGQITEFPIPEPTTTETGVSGPVQLAVDPTSIVAGPDGALWFTESSAQAIGRITTTGTITTIPTPGLQPNSIAVGSDGNIWFTDDSDNNTVDRINPDQSISTFPIPTQFAQPNDLTLGPDGALYFTEGFNQAIGRVDMSGNVTETKIDADMASPNQLAFDNSGDLWVSGSNAGLVEITPSGTTTTVFTPSSSSAISAIDSVTLGPDGAIWFTEDGGGIGRVDPETVVSAPTDHVLTVAMAGMLNSTISNPLEINGSVATFYDSNSTGALSDYTATIDWGDGSTSAGTITETTPGAFNVSSDHVYAQSGNYTVTVTVADTNPNVTPQPDQASASTPAYLGVILYNPIPVVTVGPVLYTGSSTPTPIPVVVAAPGSTNTGSAGTPVTKTPTTTLPNIGAILQTFENNLKHSGLKKSNAASPYSINVKRAVIAKLAVSTATKPTHITEPVVLKHAGKATAGSKHKPR